MRQLNQKREKKGRGGRNKSDRNKNLVQGRYKQKRKETINNTPLFNSKLKKK